VRETAKRFLCTGASAAGVACKNDGDENSFISSFSGARPVPDCFMLLSRVPIRVVADNPHEYQAFADVLGSGQAGALALAADGEAAIVVLVCPSGRIDANLGVPAVILGASPQDTGDMPYRHLTTPAVMSDIFDAIESLAQEALDLSDPRGYADWHLEPARLLLRSPDGRAITLTDTEARLLAMLFDASGQELDKDTLLQRVWGYRPGLDTHTLETHIYRLRQKIETNPTNPAFLMTTDAGYRLAA
jgi:hypothetical protein